MSVARLRTDSTPTSPRSPPGEGRLESPRGGVGSPPYPVRHHVSPLPYSSTRATVSPRQVPQQTTSNKAHQPFRVLRAFRSSSPADDKPRTPIPIPIPIVIVIVIPIVIVILIPIPILIPILIVLGCPDYDYENDYDQEKWPLCITYPADDELSLPRTIIWFSLSLK